MHEKVAKKRFKIFIIFIIYIQYNCLAIRSLFSDEIRLFSSKVKNNSNLLFIVKDNDAFIRKTVGRRFEYVVPDDRCYELSGDLNVCIKDQKVASINGNFINMYNKFEKISTNCFTDLFFNEKNTDCDIMKFDIINKILVKQEQINGFGLQIYLPDYYSVLRLFLYRLNDNDTNLKAFVISDRNDVSCSPFNDYKIYKIVDDYSNNTKKNKKNIIKKTKTKREFLKKISIESYKKMLLKDYIYIEPTNSIYDTEKIVLSIKNDSVLYMNSVSLEFRWENIGFNDIFTIESNKSI